MKPGGFGRPVTFLAYSLSQCVPLSMSRRSRRQAKMSSRIHGITRAVAIAAMLALSSPALSGAAVRRSRCGAANPAARESVAPAHRPERGTAIPQPAARGAAEGAAGRCAGSTRRLPQPRPVSPPRLAAQPAPAPLRQPQVQPGVQPGPQIAAPAPIVQEPPQGLPPTPGRRRGDAFDPSQNPNAPGAPQALGGGQLPIPEAPVGAPGGRGAGEPLDLANTGGPRLRPAPCRRRERLVPRLR